MKNMVSCVLRIALGLIITALGYWAFLNPYSISVGGITGACVVLNEHFGLPYTGTLLVLNTALFVWGIKVKGVTYVVRSLVAMIVLGLLLDLQLPMMPLLNSVPKYWAMVCGSVLTGVGYGLIVAADTSTGGSDLLAMIVVKRCTFMTVGTVMNSVDLFVVLTSGLFDGMSNILFSVVAMLLCNTCIDVTAYLCGNGELPGWLLRVKNYGCALRVWCVRYSAWMTSGAVLLVVCIFIFLIREVGTFADVLTWWNA